jgi:DNA-binding transcriptional regulator LsrR (DeoR family)
MSTQIDSAFRTFGTASAVSAYRLVTPDTTTAGFVNVAVSGANKTIGVTQEDAPAAGFVTVKMFHPTFFATVSGTAAVGNTLFFDAAGQVTTLAANLATAGIALEAATATSAVIEIAIPLF